MKASVEATGSARLRDTALAADTLAHLSAPVLVLTSELRVVYANPAAELLANAGGSLLERALADIHADFANAHLEEKCRSVIASGTPAIAPFLHSSDGEWYNVHLTAAPEIGVIALWASAAEVQQLRQRLAVAEDHFDRIFHASAAGLAITDLAGHIVQVNAAFSRIVGYSPQELAGRTFRSISHPEDPVADLEGLLIRPESVVVVRKRFLTKSGDAIWVRNTISLIRAADGNPSHFLGLCENINEQYLAEQKLRASEWRFRSLIESTTDIITIVLPDGTVSYVSPSAERALGYRPDERIGTNVLEHVHADDIPAVRREMSDSLTRYGRSVTLELRVRHKDGTWRTMEVTGRNLIHNPVIGGLVLSWRDVTERVEARAKIREYSAELERQHLRLVESLSDAEAPGTRMDLLTSIAEDIRTPIIGIAGISDLLLETRLEPAQRDCAARIRDSAQNLLTVVDGFLRISGADQPGE
jgi:PAS domain S-box-containing protein